SQGEPVDLPVGETFGEMEVEGADDSSRVVGPRELGPTGRPGLGDQLAVDERIRTGLAGAEPPAKSDAAEPMRRTGIPLRAPGGRVTENDRLPDHRSDICDTSLDHPTRPSEGLAKNE